mmetsp:Transcript_2976/g.8724  ORF Transcript_2976/g.8724 Transcript_2976/m.8724 type:complete len:212 (-) Transcript_2976:1293-1928(-)|eukprot:CAMPEP_0206147862 /NCGR_PEP_ID=MMETSP1473-20131121/34788_1 /ASSEMBLY_ACC=CAM_ASM_001109 /TAXON_ID=1461547 /ORGANISM="Stichococcus sp, Strain RCC1054" /LENGTH=211 /DNA_ID=CAMNT_0053544973 /DNA_START=555 /DNA_END=1190 /DNA_ORIENTATION=+
MAEKVLSLGDVCVRRSDAELLRPGCWLNDTCIALYFELITLEKYPEANVLLLPGCTTFFLLNGDNTDVQQQLAQMQAETKQLVVLAVNDNSLVDEANGGSHWSLLSFTGSDGTFRHYDSCAPSANTAVARRLAAKLRHPLGGSEAFEEVSVPHQSNAYDCGVHVLATADVLCERVHARQPVSGDATSEVLHRRCQPSAVAALRRLLLAMFE